MNGVEPVAPLLVVMQHLMSHNGHLKTAIIPDCAGTNWRHRKLLPRF